jgi:hypothetical protein
VNQRPACSSRKYLGFLNMKRTDERDEYCPA